MASQHPKGEYVVILDAGSQYTKVIDRKVRELQVESIILPLDTATATLRDDPQLKGIIISGGPSSVYDADAPAYNKDLFTVGKPILGICYGMQLLAMGFEGGEVKKEAIREDGQDTVNVDTTCPLFTGLEPTQTVLLTHGTSVTKTGPSLRVTALSAAGIISATQHTTLPLFGVQFHPEVDLTVNGMKIFRNFLQLCGCSFSFTMEDREEVAVRFIRDRTKNGQKVLCLLSGGVDSTVCAVLLNKAIGADRVVCIHIDHGFMRHGESLRVVQILTEHGISVKLIQAADIFVNATTEMPARRGKPAYRTKRLCDTVHPEEKRTIIGDTFMAVCDKVIKDLQLDMDNLILAQGTLRPDLIESGSTCVSKVADAIKTHHNDTAVVRRMRDEGRIIEPLSDYHKDEVRELGVRLGLPRVLVERQPFPGPGLAIRTLCSDGTPFRDDAYAETERVVSEVVHGVTGANLMSSAALATVKAMELASCVLPVKSVGVQGDGRTYAYPAAISLGRFPTAEEWQSLIPLAKAIPKVAHSVNRVTFMFGPKESISPSAVTPTYLRPDTLDKLREADAIVNRHLQEHELVRRLSQVPVVLVPVGFDKVNGYSIVIRTFITNDFMTGVPAIPGSEYLPSEVLEKIVTEVQALPFVGRVLYDLTSKPPGTTEWE